MLFSASKTIPDGKAPSPITATARRFGFAEQVIAAGEAGDRRHAAAGVARHEQVVVALVRVGIAHQPALGADRLESRGSAR